MPDQHRNPSYHYEMINRKICLITLTHFCPKQADEPTSGPSSPFDSHRAIEFLLSRSKTSQKYSARLYYLVINSLLLSLSSFHLHLYSYSYFTIFNQSYISHLLSLITIVNYVLYHMEFSILFFILVTKWDKSMYIYLLSFLYLSFSFPLMSTAHV